MPAANIAEKLKKNHNLTVYNDDTKIIHMSTRVVQDKKNKNT